MLQHAMKVHGLDSIPGLRITGISENDGNVPEIEVSLEYETEKSIKLYKLIAGINGLRIELDHEKRRRRNN